MKMVVLDGHTANPGDLSWEELEALGNLRVYDRTPPEKLIERLTGVEIALTNKTPLSREQLSALPALKYIGVMATGVNVVDLEAASDLGIVVTNVPAYGTKSVAQHVFALLLELTNQVGLHDAAVQNGEWAQCEDFCFTKSPLVELEGRTLGIIGLGDIGLAVAQLGMAFGMKVIAHSRSPKSIPGIRMVDQETLISTADVISLHCPLTRETEGLFDAKNLGKMKPTAYLINTGRGPFVDELALAEALFKKRLAGVGLDVLSSEPPPADHPLVGLPRCVITPHIAWATQEARSRLMSTCVANVAAFQKGQPIHVVHSS